MSEDLRARILETASRLLAEGGAGAVSTRAVSAAAGVHAPTLYRLFGDKNELMDAVAAYVLASYLERKAALPPTDDPVEDLRRGWDLHIGFGLENPDAYAALYASKRDASSSAAEASESILREMIHRIAEAGRLTVPEPVATHLVHVAGTGTVLSLAKYPRGTERDRLTHEGFEMVRRAITSDRRDDGTDAVAQAATTLIASLPTLPQFTNGERGLLTEWLARVE
ncbi:TetR/AcrR family transcriptional regulator [Myxococcus sp. K15C18031901]|uniref:TetR/AcrR family transcriptional regulator n=1 Tax=Myxococcus dinghuensis TaxID=2906761 RepID=UPI0020A80CDB|nr:TetR/AcrR family transcriptional regulator [Myxococcus dinghuensis]MCP3100782.1 TetR/AcrR family transcriptional regulator [Myxococcus dinghuensis]